MPFSPEALVPEQVRTGRLCHAAASRGRKRGSRPSRRLPCGSVSNGGPRGRRARLGTAPRGEATAADSASVRDGAAREGARPKHPGKERAVAARGSGQRIGRRSRPSAARGRTEAAYWRGTRHRRPTGDAGIEFFQLEAAPAGFAQVPGALTSGGKEEEGAPGGRDTSVSWRGAATQSPEGCPGPFRKRLSGAAAERG